MDGIGINMKQKRKVLFVVHQLNYGGVQKAVLTALNAIDYSENEVTLYVRKNRLQLLPDVNKKVSKVIINEDKTHYYRKPYTIYLMLCKNCCRLLRLRKKADDFHQRIVGYLNKSQMLYEKKHYFNNDVQYDVAISYIQGYTTKFVAEYIRAKRKIMFYHVSTDENHHIHEKSMAYFDAIVGVNEGVQNVLKGLYSDYADKMTYIENYVDADEILMKSKAYSISRDKNQIVLCSCGRFAPVKGFDLAVEAAVKLKDKGINFIWYFVGDGPERANLESLIIDNKLNKNIVITGLKDNPYPYIAGCDIYVQPSYEESFGLTIAEAKILCKPIVSTATLGGNKQIVNNENGILTGISGKEIADGINRFLEDDNLQGAVVQNLKNIDYNQLLKEYQFQWKRLLRD